MDKVLQFLVAGRVVYEALQANALVSAKRSVQHEDTSSPPEPIAVAVRPRASTATEKMKGADWD